MRCTRCGRDPEYTSPATRKFREATCGQCHEAFELSEKARLEKLRLERLIKEQAKERIRQWKDD